MFAFKPRTEIVIRALLIMAVVSNALIPTAAAALPLSEGSTEGNNGSTVGLSALSPILQQDDPPTATPTDTEPATPEAVATPSFTSEPTSTEELTSATPSPTFETTPIPSDTPSPTQASVQLTGSPDLSIEFSVIPEKAKIGDQVTFTLKVVNNGQSPVTGLRFSNVIPEIFSNVQSDNENVDFDSKTRELTWEDKSDPAQGGGAALASGESLTLQYTAIVASDVIGAQIVETAIIHADGLEKPLTAEATLLLIDSKSSLTLLDAKGGEALGLNGQVKVTLPENSLDAPAIVFVQDLRSDSQLPTDGVPWLVFELQVQSLQPQNAQFLTASGIDNLPLQDPDASIQEGSVDEENLTPTTDAQPTTIPEDTATSVPDGEITSEEKDRIIPFGAIEAKFDEPVELAVSLDGLVDLSTLSADKTPFLVTLDEDSDTWVRIPLETINREANTVTAKLTHFSTWGVGVGSAFPQNHAGVLMFDSAYPSLFKGTSNYSLPIWTPPGRNGMAPSLALSYSSGTVEGVLGDVQAPWAGMGWNIDSVEIARKITNGGCSPCGSGSYGYENKFILLFNGTGHELIPDGTTPGRYHTKDESFLYVLLHNPNLGNNSPAKTISTREWWEVVEKDGTRWRLGWNADSEQLAAMKGYPGAATGSWASLGYAGVATNVVASRWRVDQVTDVYGNRMTFTYFEENRTVAGTSTNYNKASYLDTISYTSHTSGTPAAGYSVVFVRVSRAGSDVPASPAAWDNWDGYLLDRIDVKQGSTVKRSYDLGYTVRSYTDDNKSWQTTTLTSVAVTGGSTTAPTVTFDYEDFPNKAVSCSDPTGCYEWAYPRLETVSNGWEGIATYTYGNDGRPHTSWYNYRVETLDIADGVGTSPMKTLFSYVTPCYDDETEGWCNSNDIGGLIGYAETTATTKDFNGTTTLAVALHKFHTDEQKSGRTFEVQNKDAGGTILSQTNSAYTIVTSGLPTGVSFTYTSAVENYLRTTSLIMIGKTEYEYSATTGNLNWVKEYNGTPSLYRQTDYEYVTNTSPSVWILNTISRQTFKDSGGTVLSKQEYGYNGNLPGSGSPTTNQPDLSRVVNGTQTIDTKYVYDTWGNVTETRLFKAYGSTGSQPSGTYLSYTDIYETTYRTYATSTDTPLIPATTIAYDYGLGLPTTVTDPNGNATVTAYDGLGRVTSVKYPGFASPNIKYTYPTPSGSPLAVGAPFAMKMEMWDQTASVYRSAWQMMDGLGRVIQTQGPYETAGDLVLNDTLYDARGLPQYQGLSRTLTGSGGSHFSPSWGSVPHSTTLYDALGRVTSVTYPDSNQETFSYSGLRTTVVDRNDHQKVQENDAFGRLVKLEEYTGSGTYTLYATTTYEYDPRGLLQKVTDAAGNETIIGYNGFGRKDTMSDPDLGSWSYGYSVLGNLTSQTDARGCVTMIDYDDLSRPLTKTFTGPGACDSTPDVTYTYDSTTSGNEGLGRRTSMTDGSGSTTYFYNILGQMTNETHNIDSTNYSLVATFDAFGRPLTQTLPSTEVLTYSYNDMGALSGLSGTNTYVSNIHYNASGQVADQQLGNGLIQQSCYEADTLRLSNLRVYPGSVQTCGARASSLRLDLAFSYQANGNISQISDAIRNETLTYVYDELDRLLGTQGPYEKNQSYNTIGNLVSTSNVLAVAPGAEHTCILTANGGVKCWGRNNEGQLGDGTTTNRTSPVDVSGLTSGASAISSGAYHTCVLTTAGGVKCWGDNSNGQLGDGTTTDRTAPVPVSGLTSGVLAITAGGYHTCALTTAGGVKCWGDNNDGQIGDGTTTDRTAPVNVSGLTSGVKSIDAGGWHTCAVTTSGGAKCWGSNSGGQIGDGTITSPRTAPLDVSGLTSGVASISAGGIHTCALTTSGGVKCWGVNSDGQVGDGTTTDRTTPVNVSGLTSDVAALDAGGWHTCALTTSGGLKCWGDNGYGQVGDGTTTNRTAPVNVSGSTSGVVSVTSGVYHTCELMVGGEVKCWGVNVYGQLGYSAFGYSATPTVTSFSTTTTYTYGDSAHKHAVTALSTGESYTYDANGNMTQRVEGGLTYTQTFDAENRLISVTVSGQTTSFVYDGDGNLVKKVKPDGSKTIYVGGVYEVDKTSGGSTIRTVTYYPVAGAMRVDSTLYYVLKDHLGSASVVTDSSGNIVGEQRYYPFGKTRLSTGTMVTDKLFTGQRAMEDLGIYHYGARFYSPGLGRFLSADSIVPGYTDPQNLNRYSYVGNSPLNYTDPTGHARIQDGPQQDKFKPSVANKYVPKPKPKKGNKGGGGTDNKPKKDGDSLSDNSGGSSGGGGGCNLSTLTNSNGDYCHHTTYTPKQICFDVFECDPREQADYASRFQYPGQMPWNPINPLAERTDGYVMGGDFMSDNYYLQQKLRQLGAVYVETDGSTMTNYTKITHIFYQGQINRTVSGNYVTTEGYGTNANIAIATANQYGGPIAFEINDAAMITFSTVDQLSHGMLVELMNAIP